MDGCLTTAFMRAKTQRPQRNTNIYETRYNNHFGDAMISLNACLISREQVCNLVPGFMQQVSDLLGIESSGCKPEPASESKQKSLALHLPYFMIMWVIDEI